MADKEALKNSISDRIRKFVTDTATLDVLTLTGTIELTPKPKPKAGAGGAATEPGEMDMDKLFAKVLKELETGDKTKVSVVAYTHAEWDQDSVNFVAEGANPDLVANHRETVADSHSSRVLALASAAETVKNLF